MTKNIALTLMTAGGFLLLFNVYEFVFSENGWSTWVRIASNICIILVGALSLKNIKNENRRNNHSRN